MREELKILIAFNSEEYIKLILREVKKSGYRISWKRVTSADVLNDVLSSEDWDVILSEEIIDDSFTAMDILRVKNDLEIQTPLILICEDIKSENIVKLMKLGCSNCILNNNISSIGSILLEEFLGYRDQLDKTMKIKRMKKDYDTLLFNVRRYKLAIEGSNDGIWDWDLVNDKGFISYKWKEMIGLPSCELENFSGTWIESLHPDDVDTVTEAIISYLDKKTPYYMCEYRMRAKNSDYIWVLSRGKAIRDNDGKLIRMAGSHTNITEQKKAEEKINHLAYYDSVTDLANRTLFEERLNKCIIDSKKNKEMFGLVYLDLDNFKTVNDTLGHAFGDLLLVDVAGLINESISDGDLAARLSGDEFAILIPRLKSDDRLKALAESIMDKFQEPFILDNHEIYVTVSIGIAVYPTDGEDGQALLKNADTAMYCAKETGKNTYRLYVPEMNIKITEKINLQNELRRAVKNQEFSVHYQPQISMKTGKIVGFEALIRWFHPIKGFISPMKFIPEAEEMGIISDIGEFVLRTACKQNKLWQDAGYLNMYMAVNLSARQFQQKNLVSIVEGILMETGLNAKSLELEITESISMQDLELTIKILNNFNEMGVQVALDDFGTGYSSLNYLKKLPIQNLKIDKSFVDNITSNPKELAIAEAITTLAHTMNLSIVAEGVETKEQYLLLRELRCDKAQGYLFSRPLPPEEVEKMLKLEN